MSTKNLFEAKLIDHPRERSQLVKLIKQLEQSVRKERSANDSASADQRQSELSAQKAARAKSKISESDRLEYQRLVVESIFHNTVISDDWMILEGQFADDTYSIELNFASEPVVYATNFDNANIARTLTAELQEALETPDEALILEMDARATEVADMIGTTQQLDESALSFMKGAASAVGRKLGGAVKRAASGVKRHASDVINAGKAEYHGSKARKHEERSLKGGDAVMKYTGQSSTAAKAINNYLRTLAREQNIRFTPGDIGELVSQTITDSSIASAVKKRISMNA